MRSIYILFIVLVFVLLSDATTHKVPSDFSKIQLAVLAASNGDTIMVAEGTYLENIIITKRIVLGSHFLLDGDTSHISRTIIDGSQPSHADSASVVTFGAGTDSTSAIIGFTITGGKGNKHLSAKTNQYMYSGGGINVHSGGATIRHNIITGNSISTNSSLAWGGGIGVGATFWPIDNSYVIIEYNTVIGNTLATTGLSLSGGIGFSGTDGKIRYNSVLNNTSQYIAGISATNDSFAGVDTIIIEGNLVQGNHATKNGAGITAYGGGAFVTVRKNVVIDNSADLWYGGVMIGDTCVATVEGNYIVRNHNVFGGALYFYSNPKNTIAVNNIIAQNSGYGVVLGTVSGGYTANACLINNTIVENTGPGICAAPASNSIAYAINNIVKNDSSLEVLGTVYTSNNLIEGGYFGGGEDIDSDPKFIIDDSLYHLSNSSPCIGTGIQSTVLNSVPMVSPLFDYCNAPRPQTPGTNPDMGAVECPLNSPTEVVYDRSEFPSSFALSQNYPNPFNPTTTIEYQIPASGSVSLIVFDAIGREVATLVYEVKEAGYYSATFDGSEHSSGIYFVQLRSGGKVQLRKMLMLK